MFNVADCKIHWQKAGDYLCVKVDRYAKIKREKGDVKYSVRHLIYIYSTLIFFFFTNNFNKCKPIALGYVLQF